MVLSINATPTTIAPNGISTVTATLLYDNQGVYHNPAKGVIPYTGPANFATNKGTIVDTNFSQGMAKSKFSFGTATGVSNVTATVDSQSVNTQITLDKIPPTVIKVDPANKAVINNVSNVVKFTFSEPIKKGSMWIEFLKGSNAVAFTTSPITSGTKTLTLTPTQTLTNGTFTIILHTGSINDTAGNPLAYYTTKFTVDTTPPTVKTINPAKNALNIPVNQLITVTFTEPIRKGTMWFEFNNSTGAVPFNTFLTGNTLTITPTATLSKGTKCTLILHTGCVNDTAGNPLAYYTSSFTTTKT
jgi:hypothetical protein